MTAARTFWWLIQHFGCYAYDYDCDTLTTVKGFVGGAVAFKNVLHAGLMHARTHEGVHTCMHTHVRSAIVRALTHANTRARANCCTIALPRLLSTALLYRADRRTTIQCRSPHYAEQRQALWEEPPHSKAYYTLDFRTVLFDIHAWPSGGASRSVRCNTTQSLTPDPYASLLEN